MQRDLYQNALQERVLCELSQWTSEWDWRGAKVLDVGSRYGHRSEQLARRLAPLRIDGIRGVDTDVRGIEFATQHLADEKLEFSYIADLEDRLPLKYSQAFDWVLHINPTLFHLNNQEAALRNLLWCLKPSTGRLLLAIPCHLPAAIAATTAKVILKKMGKQLNQWMAEALDVNKKPWYGHPQADRIYAHIMERVGFRVHRTKIMDFKYNFEKKIEHRASLESYYFDVIMSFPEEQREGLAKRLHSSAAGFSLRSVCRWETRYVLVLASRPALTCSVCYGPRHAQDSMAAGDRRPEDGGDSPPPVPLVGPPPDVEDDLGEMNVGVIHNDDLANACDSEDEQAGDDEEGCAANIKRNLYGDNLNEYDRASDYEKSAEEEDGYIVPAFVGEKKKDHGTTDASDRHHTEEAENIYNLNGSAGIDETSNLDKSHEVKEILVMEASEREEKSDIGKGNRDQIEEGKLSENEDKDKETAECQQQQQPDEATDNTEKAVVINTKVDESVDEEAVPKDIPSDEQPVTKVEPPPANAARTQRSSGTREAAKTANSVSKDSAKGIASGRGARRRRQDV